MPPVVGAFGRGSPTGVVCYRHRQFPKDYHNAVFALDWTFGRVVALPLQRDGSTWKSKPITFMTGVGEFGFAPTDVAVGPDGSLFVSVGGRGTRGGVYRVRYVGKESGSGIRKNSAATAAEFLRIPLLDQCLHAPQPLSSWSRAKWEPLAKKLGARVFEQAAVEETRTDAERIRAIEILTDVFGGLDTPQSRPILTGGTFVPDAWRKLAKAKSPEVRARAIWSHGRIHAAAPSVSLVKKFLADKSPQVRRAALESLLAPVRLSTGTRWSQCSRIGWEMTTALSGWPPRTSPARMPLAAVEKLRTESRKVSAAVGVGIRDRANGPPAQC